MADRKNGICFSGENHLSLTNVIELPRCNFLKLNNLELFRDNQNKRKNEVKRGTFAWSYAQKQLQEISRRDEMVTRRRKVVMKMGKFVVSD